MALKSLWLIFAVFFNSFASGATETADTGDSEEYCSKTFGLCKLDFSRKDLDGLLVPGRQGPPGVKGDQGPKGIRGPDGKHSCGDAVTEVDDNSECWGLEDEPADKTCKNGPSGISGIRYIYKKAVIEVNCNQDTRKTCPTITTTGKEVAYRESKPFWLSEKGVTLKQIYGLDADQLLWLQRESYCANLTIKYHCKNSVPVGVNSLSLLTWNDIVIGPAPTETTPFYYYIENDGCSSAEEDTWSSTDIVLVSPYVERLPIIDFLIKDVRNGNQAVRIEVKELCFG